MDITEIKRTHSFQNINRHPWEITRSKIIHFLLQKNRSQPKHITDIGSGDAFVLKTLIKKRFAQKYLAIDTAYTPDIIRELTDDDHKADTISFHKDISILSEAGTRTDIFLLLDVLEHCQDDKAVLRSVAAPVPASGETLFLITVPAFQSLFSSHDNLLQHYRRYSRKQLIALCNEANLQVTESGYFFTVLLPVRAFQILLEKLKLRKATSSLDAWKGNKTIGKIFCAILWADFRVNYFLTKIGLRIPGLSCYSICRKSPS